MPEQPIEVRRHNTALERILKFLNDALNRPPSEITLLAELRAQLVVARKISAEQDLSERDALIQAGSSAPNFNQLEKDITQEEQVPALPGAPQPQRKPYTLADAETVFADSQVMAEQLVLQRTGRQPDRATQRAIGAYLVDNLFSEQRGVPDGLIEGFAEQVTALQKEAITRNPESATQGRRFQGFINALLDSDNPSASIDLETYRALVFPATPFADIPARFRAGDVPSLAVQAQIDAKALDVINNLSINMLANLQKIVDIARGPTGVTNFGEAAVRVVAAQTEEEVVAGTATLPSVDSPSEIRAQRRETAALSALEDETKLKNAVEDAVGSPGLLTDKDEQRNKTQAVRRVVDSVSQLRRDILSDNPSLSDEEVNRLVAPFLAQETEPKRFDQILSEVAEEIGALNLGNLDDIEEEFRAILGRAGLDAGEISPELFTQTAQMLMELDPEDRVAGAQQIVPAFDILQQETERLKFDTLGKTRKELVEAFGAAGLDFAALTKERQTSVAQAVMGSGDPSAAADQATSLFPLFQREAANIEFVEGGTGTLAERLEAGRGARLPDLPGTEEAVQRLADSIRFRAQADPFADIDQLLQSVFQSAAPPGAEGFGPLRVAGEDGRVLGTPEDITDPELRFRIQAEQDLEPTDPLLRSVFERLRFEPTGGGLIDPASAALIQGTPGARQRFGAAPPTLPGLPTFGNVQVPEAPIGFGEITPLLREASGDNLAFLSFLFQPEQLRGLQAGFGEARRREVQEERGRIQTIGEDFSTTLQTIEGSLRDVGGPTGPGGAFLVSERDRLRGRIGTTSQFGRLASPSLAIPQFVESQIGGLRERFAGSPAGLREEQRLTAQAESDTRRAESDRRRRLRGGRTVFQRV